MRIAIVNDLVTAVENLRRIVLSVSGMEITWIAKDGNEAVKMHCADPPDLILMDIIMPVMDGVEATRRIMKASPCPILIVTATIGTNAAKVFEAMGHGALDAVSIPPSGTGDMPEQSKSILLKKIHLIKKIMELSPESKKSSYTDILPPLVIAGSSTGGPKALARMLSAMPAKTNAAIVVVQHVDEKFSAGLADWLDAQTILPVKVAPEGGSPKENMVYVAGSNDHLIITSDFKFAYTPEPYGTNYRPSVDVFFKSVIDNWPDPFQGDLVRGRQNIAVLLTGMGKDGAEGLATLRRAGWHTIAQDERTSVVYGMPKAAMELNAAVEVLPIDDIGSSILARITHTK